MRIADMNWMQVESYLHDDDRAVLPLGCTEQHAYLSLSVDSILAARVALEAAEPVGVPVFPVLAYGITPYFMAYPGTVTLRTSTYLSVIYDLLSGMIAQGFHRIVIVNGHGGNNPAQSVTDELMREHESQNVRIRWHNWWAAPRTMAKVREIDPVASHASWMENFPWTRLPDAESPSNQKTLIDSAKLRQMGPIAARAYLGDGNFGGYYQRSDEEMMAIWQIGVAETREQIEFS